MPGTFCHPNSLAYYEELSVVAKAKIRFTSRISKEYYYNISYSNNLIKQSDKIDKLLALAINKLNHHIVIAETPSVSLKYIRSLSSYFIEKVVSNSLYSLQST